MAVFNDRTPPALPAACLLPGRAGGGGHKVRAASDPGFVARGTQGWGRGAGFLLLLLSSLGSLGSASPRDLLAWMDKSLVWAWSGSWSVCLSLVLFIP